MTTSNSPFTFPSELPASYVRHVLSTWAHARRRFFVRSDHFDNAKITVTHHRAATFRISHETTHITYTQVTDTEEPTLPQISTSTLSDGSYPSTNRTFVVQRTMKRPPCSTCHHGKVTCPTTVTCPRCMGDGLDPHDKHNRAPRSAKPPTKCRECHGETKVPCHRCEGKGSRPCPDGCHHGLLFRFRQAKVSLIKDTDEEKTTPPGPDLILTERDYSSWQTTHLTERTGLTVEEVKKADALVNRSNSRADSRTFTARFARVTKVTYVQSGRRRTAWIVGEADRVYAPDAKDEHRMAIARLALLSAALLVVAVVTVMHLLS